MNSHDICHDDTYHKQAGMLKNTGDSARVGGRGREIHFLLSLLKYTQAEKARRGEGVAAVLRRQAT